MYRSSDFGPKSGFSCSFDNSLYKWTDLGFTLPLDTLLAHILASLALSSWRMLLDIATKLFYIGTEPKESIEPLCDAFRRSGTGRRMHRSSGFGPNPSLVVVLAISLIDEPTWVSHTPSRAHFGLPSAKFSEKPG